MKKIAIVLITTLLVSGGMASAETRDLIAAIGLIPPHATPGIETLRGAALHFPFKIMEIDSFRQGILRVLKGRIDGFIAEHDGTDKFDELVKSRQNVIFANCHSMISSGCKIEN